jgi:hypothetical protein
MKKIIAAAAGLLMVGTMVTSASAFESKFGGYWRTRMLTTIDMAGTDAGSLSYVDTRTRLYYTAIFNENFKFVNKFEFNNTWGDGNGGDVGADGTSIFKIKNSYADFKLGAATLKVGTQGATIARGFLFADDFSGIVAVIPAGNVTLPLAWVKVDDEDKGGKAYDRDYYAAMPIIKVTDAVTLNPYLIYDKAEGEDWNNYYAGIDVDVKMDAFSAWGTGIYEFGEIVNIDTSAFLVAGGASAGPVHGQVFYASGQDATDSDRTAFVSPTGASYYWSEIMGLGMFDQNTSNGSPADHISNVWAANVGFSVAPMDKLSLGADVWYAALVEDDAAGNTELGTEFDVTASYKIYDNLKLDVVAAYLLAGDATADDDPIELGAQLSLSF